MVSGKLLLLVEDDKVTAKLQTRLLENYGYRVIHAPSGESAVSMAGDNGEISMVLMDIDLGDGAMDGTQAARKILENRQLPLIFLSSHTEKDVVALTEQITNYGYVVKTSGITVLDASIKMAFKLFEEKQKSAHILRSVREGILGLDLEGKITFLNQAVTDILGYREEDLTGKPVHGVLHRQVSGFPGIPEAECPVCRSVKEHTTVRVSQDTFVRADGSVIPIQLTVSPLMDQNTVTGSVMTFSDISQRIRTQELEEAQNRQQALHSLAEEVGNDFHNLFGALFGAVEMASGLNRDPQVESHLCKAREVLKQSRERTRQLMDYATGAQGTGISGSRYQGSNTSTAGLSNSPGPALPESPAVLILDDNPLMRETFQEMIQALGYRPEAAETSSRLMELFRQESAGSRPVKAVILDHHLALGDHAEELVKELKSLSPGLPVYLTSGTDSPPSMQNPREYGFDGRLLKPFLLRELADLLK